MRVLFLSRWLPWPPDNGSKIRIYNLLKELAATHQVALISLDDSGNGPLEPSPLTEMCHSVDVVPHRAFRPTSTRALLGIASRTPRFLVDSFRPELDRARNEVMRRFSPDLIIVSQLDMIPYALRVQGIPLVLEELELTTYIDAVLRAPSYAKRVRATLTLFKLTSYLRRALPRFAMCTAVSEIEVGNIRRAVPEYERVAVLPNAVDVGAYAKDFGSVDGKSIVFAGALSYGPNRDAAQLLVEEIFPRISARHPDAQLRINGRDPEPALAALLARKGVELTGYLDDIRPLVARSAVSVAPIRYGGGTRLKILESMALGTPVVASTKAAEGLNVCDGQNIVLADESPTFAECVSRVLASPEYREQLAESGLRLVRSQYDWRVVGPRARRIFERAAAGGMSENAAYA